jgi:hypothetical protein
LIERSSSSRARSPRARVVGLGSWTARRTSRSPLPPALRHALAAHARAARSSSAADRHRHRTFGVSTSTFAPSTASHAHRQLEVQVVAAPLEEAVGRTRSRILRGRRPAPADAGAALAREAGCVSRCRCPSGSSRGGSGLPGRSSPRRRAPRRGSRPRARPRRPAPAGDRARAPRRTGPRAGPRGRRRRRRRRSAGCAACPRPNACAAPAGSKPGASPPCRTRRQRRFSSSEKQRRRRRRSLKRSSAFLSLGLTSGVLSARACGAFLISSAFARAAGSAATGRALHRLQSTASARCGRHQLPTEAELREAPARSSTASGPARRLGNAPGAAVLLLALVGATGSAHAVAATTRAAIEEGDRCPPGSPHQERGARRREDERIRPRLDRGAAVSPRSRAGSAASSRS